VSGTSQFLTSSVLPNISNWFGDDSAADSLLQERMATLETLDDIETAEIKETHASTQESKPVVFENKQDSKMLEDDSFNTSIVDIDQVEESDKPLSYIPDLSSVPDVPLMEVVGGLRTRNISTKKLESIPEIQHEGGSREGEDNDILELRENQLMTSMNENSRLRDQIDAMKQEKDAQKTQIEELISEGLRMAGTGLRSGNAISQLQDREAEMAREIKDLKKKNDTASLDCTWFMDQIALLKEQDMEKTGK
jgi:hypothetical protein